MMETIGCSGDASEAIFQVPHARMKELVNMYLKKFQNIDDFSKDVDFLENVLQSVYKAMWELKSHEYIEDTYIMNRLKDRLQAKRVYNKVVCNCHTDSKLLNVIDLVERLYYARDIGLRQEFGAQLQCAMREFLEEFIHHMSEEEAIFQPLLHKYFDKKELEGLRDIVLEQHRLWKEKVLSEKSLKLVKRKREEVDDYLSDDASIKIDKLRFRRSYCEEVNDFFGKYFTASYPAISVQDLPNEVMLRIFDYLSPYDLISSCTRVSRRWNRIAMTPSLWTNLFPVLWFRGDWTFSLEEYQQDFCADEDDKQYSFLDEDDNNNPKCKVDEEDDDEGLFIKNISNHLLPKIGTGVRRLFLAGSRSLTTNMARSYLKKVPNLKELDMSYSPNIDDDTFKGLRRYAALRQLTFLDLSGCKKLTDVSLERLSSCYFPLRRTRKMSQVKKISLSGCHRITNEGLDRLQVHAASLESLDLSGCFHLAGRHLKAFIDQCSKLQPEGLFYCNMITDGPYPNSANGCQNLDCPLRNCCQTSGILY